MIFDVYCAPFIEKAIDGYVLFGEDYPAECLRRACQLFPDGKIPRTTSLIEQRFFAADFRHVKSLNHAVLAGASSAVGS